MARKGLPKNNCCHVSRGPRCWIPLRQMFGDFGVQRDRSSSHMVGLFCCRHDVSVKILLMLISNTCRQSYYLDEDFHQKARGAQIRTPSLHTEPNCNATQDLIGLLADEAENNLQIFKHVHLQFYVPHLQPNLHQQDQAMPAHLARLNDKPYLLPKISEPPS